LVLARAFPETVIQRHAKRREQKLSLTRRSRRWRKRENRGGSGGAEKQKANVMI
jgi:hypothetical protein